ncbi:hypothetical protein MKW94_013262 [Papaver nudicaule]|uniref:Uncharacterized protein n=1 Tax=Papaver nudicaule TaxID=74823 RepID=A0AA41S9Q9_PAPNU|nr:hypothetical protein [Papaver nudicaule]
MEKLKLARNICKTVYGLRYRTIDQRVRNTAQKFNTIRDELTRVRTDPELNEEAQLVLRLTEQYSKAVGKLGRDYTHFKVHEEPGLERIDLLRNYTAPAVSATLGCMVVFADGYEGYVKRKYVDRICQLKLLGSCKANLCKLDRNTASSLNLCNQLRVLR